MTSSTRFIPPVRTLAYALCAAVAAPITGSAEPTEPPVAKVVLEWRTDLETALAEAAKNHKTVLLRFTASWCAPCRVMDARVWPDPSVRAELAGKYIIVKSDIDHAPSQLLAQKYGVRGFPTLLLLDNTGKEIGRRGFMSISETVDFLKTTGAKAILP